MKKLTSPVATMKKIIPCHEKIVKYKKNRGKSQLLPNNRESFYRKTAMCTHACTVARFFYSFIIYLRSLLINMPLDVFL